MSTSEVAEYLRANKQLIADDWERVVLADLKELAQLDRATLIDHLPEVLDALASWIEGKTDHASRLFGALADGHAMQRLGYGIELSVLNIEYGWLRHVLLTHLLAVPSTQKVRNDLIHLNDGLDRAIQYAVRRYAEQREHLRDRFIGILGHDLRNPLGAASSATHVLLTSHALEGNERRAAEVIARALKRMSRMVGDVLDFARGHLGSGIPTKVARCDMGEICRSACDELQTAHPDRRFELVVHGDLEGTFDRERVLQALGNLLSNAVHHGEGLVKVHACETSDRRAIITSVSNAGRAIPAALVRKLFDPFVSSSDTAKGTLGLGLFIVSEIARAHGATCDVASRDGETTFTILWPRVPREETPARP